MKWRYPWMIPAAILAGGAFAQDRDFSKVEIKPEKVAGNISVLAGEGGNIGVCAGEDGVVLVDDQFAPLTPKIEAAVKKIHPGPIRFVVNTHCHHDHVGGNENLGKAGAVIVAHENVRKRMSKKQFIQFFEKAVPAYPKAALPVVTFAEDVTLHLNGEEILVFHVAPAHTDTDSVVYFRNANTVHMGDLFFSESYPFIDTSSGGGSAGVIQANERVLGMIDGKTRVIPGHGPMSNKAGVERYVAMLKQCRANVLKLVDAGNSLKEVQAARPTQKYDAKWGQGWLKPDSFVELLYQDLNRK
jgi:cyclase